MNDEVIDIEGYEQPVSDPKQVGIEVRRQGQRNSCKDLVFDPATGEFVIGGDGIRTGGDVVTQMTEDGFAADRVRYNDTTGEFEPMPAEGRPRGGSGTAHTHRANTVRERAENALGSCRGVGWILAGGLVSTFASSWVGGALIAYGLARKFDIV